jgi:hypothetical protein
MRRLSHHSALITLATIAATTRLNLTRRGYLDTKRLVGDVRSRLVAGNTCAATAKPRENREPAVHIAKAPSISTSLVN